MKIANVSKELRLHWKANVFKHGPGFSAKSGKSEIDVFPSGPAGVNGPYDWVRSWDGEKVAKGSSKDVWQARSHAMASLWHARNDWWYD